MATLINDKSIRSLTTTTTWLVSVRVQAQFLFCFPRPLPSVINLYTTTTTTENTLFIPIAIKIQLLTHILFQTMDGWSEVLRIPSSVFATDNYNNPTKIANITSLQFDSVQNFIWCGDSRGYTRSFTGSFATNSLYGNLQLYPYTKFHTSDVNYNNPIKQILSHREGILSLLNNAISFNSRRGLSKLQVTSKTFNNNATTENKFNNLQAMTFNCNSFNDVVVGTDTSMMKFDLNKPNVLSSFDHQGGFHY